MILTVKGVMQGCVLSPVLFNILLEVVIALALGGKKKEKRKGRVFI